MQTFQIQDIVWFLPHTSAALTTIFIEKEKNVTEMAQPVIIPVLRQCQSDITDPEVILILKFL